MNLTEISFMTAPDLPWQRKWFVKTSISPKEVLRVLLLLVWGTGLKIVGKPLEITGKNENDLYLANSSPPPSRQVNLFLSNVQRKFYHKKVKGATNFPQLVLAWKHKDL